MIGILGGTFNPVHNGHLSIAHDVLKHLALTSVSLLPCHTPVHRESPLISTEQRVAMLQLALKQEPKLKLDLTEIERGGSSFMIDTLKNLSIEKQESLVLILGTDAFNQLHQWKQADQILNYCHIVVCQRLDEICEQNAFDRFIVSDKKSLHNKEKGCVYFLAVKPVACSSTFIRDNCANNQAIAHFLPQPVLEFMQLNKLYKSC